MFEPSLPSQLSLFALQAHRIRKLKELAQRGREGEEGKKGRMPWFIMVNEKAEKEVKQFFENNEYFGLPKKDVSFFLQQSQPCYSPDGLCECLGV